jgi:hypothetical protein
MSQTILNSENTSPSLEDQAEQMRQASEGGEGGAPEGDPGDGELILGKFKTTADLEKAYTDLEREFHARQAETEDGGGEEHPLSSAALDGYLADYIANGGKFSESVEAKLNELGAVEAATRFVQAEAAAAQARSLGVLTQAGVTAQEFEGMTAWATKEWSEDQQKAWNDLAGSPNPLAQTLAVKHLKDEFASSRGRKTRGLEGRPAPGNPAPINTVDQMRLAMSKRDEHGRRMYDTDPSYRAQVDARIAAGLGGKRG